MSESRNGFQVWMLAAGSGARAGGPKGLRLVQGKPWLQHQIEAWSALGAEHLRLGLGAHYQEHLKLSCLAQERLAAQPAPGRPSLELRRNEHWQLGPFSTLQCLAAPPLPPLPVFLTPVDVLPPRSATVTAMLQALARAYAVVPRFAGRGGHPVLLAPAYLLGLLALDPRHPQARLDWQLGQLPQELKVQLDVPDPAVLTNLNQQEAWQDLPFPRETC
jgi:CTP:molybdopterin cytidylyltransferase MocA